MANFASSGYGDRRYEPKTYTPNIFPVTITHVDPVVKAPYKRPIYFEWPDDPRLTSTPTPVPVKRSKVKTVRKPRAVHKNITVRVCQCGTPLSKGSKGMCKSCSNKSRSTGKRTTVCAICGGTKSLDAKLCKPCSIEERKARGWPAPKDAP